MKQISQKQKLQAYDLLKLQVKSVLILFVVLFAFFGIYCAGSALIGAAINLIANLLCINRMFVSSGRYEPKKLLSQFYKAESLKVAVTLLMFILVFKFLSLDSLFVIVGYSSALLSFWLAPLVAGKSKSIKLTNLENDAEQVL